MARLGNDVDPFAYTRHGPHSQLPMKIDEAIRRCCNIPLKSCFVAVVMDDGRPMTFSGSGTARLDTNVTRQFFDLDKYQRVMECLDSGANPMLEEPSEFDGRLDKQSMDFPGNRMPYHHRIPIFNDSSVPKRRGRKRPRNRDSVSDNEDARLVASVPRKRIKIGKSQDVWNFYEQRFKNCQQTACKLIAKADEKAPEWWPKPWGPTKEDKVRHKEPDHLYKRGQFSMAISTTQRVHLLNHILRMIVEPKEKQHPDIQKLNLNVKKLEEITTEALSAFFADKENAANIKKRPYLNEIFKVARQEERFKKEEINGTTEVYVMAGDKSSEPYCKNDNESITKHEDSPDTSTTKMSTVQSLRPLTPSSARRDIPIVDWPVRRTRYEIPAEQHGLVNENGMPVDGQNSVHPTGRNSASGNVVATPQYSSQRSHPSWQTDENLYGQQRQLVSTRQNMSLMFTFTQRQTDAQEANFSSLDTSYTRHSVHGPTGLWRFIVPSRSHATAISSILLWERPETSLQYMAD
ncbi:hypothetical protein EDB80DRAFT_874901 [Ilyonectria destructans]|nr:hypothetical protein EDB80DRAFT_874901 [Ilyonectria destructans]